MPCSEELDRPENRDLKPFVEKLKQVGRGGDQGCTAAVRPAGHVGGRGGKTRTWATQQIYQATLATGLFAKWRSPCD